MDKRKKQVIQDIFLVIISIIIALVLVKTGVIGYWVSHLEELKWLGVFVTGIFFTSIFTTAPSIALLSEFSQTVPLIPLSILGGIGALVGDYLIFLFVKDRVSEDVQYLLSFSREKRFFSIFKTKLFNSFVPFIAALIIASPFPDEIGVAMLGLSKIKSSTFFVLVFVLNSIGIFTVVWIANVITNTSL